MRKIAFILDYLFYAATFQQEIVSGLISAAASSDVTLFIFLGGPLIRDPYDPFLPSRNGVYELITREMFDGIIVSPSAASYAADDEVIRNFERFAGIPIVFLGSGPACYSRVETDNTLAMADLVRHFTDVHGFRNIAFICGRAGNREAAERLAGYRAQLARAGLPFNPHLVVEGDFLVSSGSEAVRILLDERRVRFDALVASNDSMALGAKQELDRRGIAVPADVALAGFDDTLDARCMIPSLTTVRQPYEEMGRRALEEIERISRGGTHVDVLRVPGEIIVRLSCGCAARTAVSRVAGVSVSQTVDPAEFYAVHREEIIRRLQELLADGKVDEAGREIGLFLDTVFDEITRGVDAFPSRATQSMVSYCLSRGLNVKIAQEAFSLMRRLFAPAWTSPESVGRAENYFHEACLSISDLQDIEKNQDLLNSLKQTDQISEVSQVLLSTVGSSGLADVLYRTFPLFHVEHFLFAEFISPDASVARVAAFLCDKRGCPEYEGIEFPSSRLMPDSISWDDRRVFFVLPVVYQDHRLGFAVFEKIGAHKSTAPTDARDDFFGGIFSEKIKGLQPIYLSLTRELAKSYYINRLITMRKEAEESLKSLTEDLEFRNRELEDFAHIASHDLKEPLRKIVLFSDRLMAGPHGLAPAAMDDALERIRKAALRMNGLLEGLLAYSRATSRNRPLEPTDLAAVLAEAIQDLEVRIGETKGRVVVRDLPVLRADPVQMRELFQNLIGNALKYHRPGVPPLVSVCGGRRGDWFVITVADNGIGFDPKYRDRIFGIFQRLVHKDEYEGAGVGLAICKKIVERHGGVISVDSVPGEGTTFTLRFPA